MLLAAQGISGEEISRRLSLTPPRVFAIRKRFERGRVAGLADQPRAGLLEPQSHRLRLDQEASPTRWRSDALKSARDDREHDIWIDAALVKHDPSVPREF